MGRLLVMWLLALSPAHGYVQNTPTENVSVKEGHTLSLKCVGSASDSSPLQWSNPKGFVAFFNNRRVLKDTRYTLTHYSPQELTISLSAVTVQDEGVYTCLLYSHPVRTTRVHVTVQAAPSSPVLEVRVNNLQQRVVLSCFTGGSRPPPRVTWLLENGMEVYGDTRYDFEPDGMKCNTTSTLTVRSYPQNSRAECVVRHESLGSEVLTAALKFTDVLTSTQQEGVALSTGATSPLQKELGSGQDGGDLTAGAATAFPNEMGSGQETLSPFVNAKLRVTSTKHEGVALSTGATSPLQKELGSGQGGGDLDSVATESVANEKGSGRETLAPFVNTKPTVKETLSSPETITSVQNTVTEMYKMEGMSKNGILLVILVGFLILTLLFIIHMFTMKLRKAHQTWRKDNETSDQTVESNKSRSNEEFPGHDGTMEAPNQKPAIYYVKECSENAREAATLDHVTETTL
ncbi:cytotoxic and regulatory T-cell molecule [Ambystoma mexicanum]|uniref:cytotoxic and regulatory T-cell molecule n=1 Tax=Ambystoma mexicanum TaxID=8296 RepID=UPI0037E97841